MVLSPVLIFSNYYSTIYIDAILGMTFGYLLAIIFVNKTYDKFSIINIGLPLAVLTLLKDVAPLFSFICLGIIFIDIVFVKKNYKILKNINKSKIKKFLKSLYPVYIFLSIILVSYISWKINVLLNGLPIAGGNGVSIKTVIKALLHMEDTYMPNVITNYISSLSNNKIFINVNFYVFSCIILLFTYLIYRKEKNDNKEKLKNEAIIIFIGEILYVFIMLVLYLLMFSEYEALNLASWDRYIGIYLNAMLFFIIYLIIYRKSKNKIGFNLFILLLFVIANAPIDNFLIDIYNNKQNKQAIYEIRQEYINAANYIKTKVDTNKKYKFYVITQHDNGYKRWILRYSIRDIMSGINDKNGWSLGKPYENDIWTVDITKDEFYNILFEENYDYVFLYDIDNQFKELYSSIFNSEYLENGQLYKINRETKTIDLL